MNIQLKILIGSILLLIATTPVYANHPPEQWSPQSQDLLESLENDVRETLSLISTVEGEQDHTFDKFQYKLDLDRSYQFDLGLVVEMNDEQSAFEVLSVTPGSLAASHGVAANDEIVNVDGIPVTAKTESSILKRIQQLKMGETLALTLVRESKNQQILVPVSGQIVPKIRLEIGPEPTQSTAYTKETQDLLEDLALRIQVTAADINENEVNAEKGEILTYTVHIPSINKVDLGLDLDVTDPANGFTVLSVKEISQAAESGIENGDVVVAVNQLQVNEANLESILAEFQSLGLGDSLALTVKQNTGLNRLTMTVEENKLPSVDIHVEPGDYEKPIPLANLSTTSGPRVQSGYVADSKAPDPFKAFDPSSTETIDYDVLTQWLEYLVVDIGRSDRRSANVHAPLGTRIAPKVKKATLFEGNRFFFESFEDNEKARQVLRDVRDSLEQIPASMPLEIFSRDEQLAYWLNLYNFTILTEIVEIYPTRDLEDFLVGENSILSKKLLTVAGIPLSLNDIQFTILKENYGDDPLVLYGLYQGIIGGPNIRKEAYTGATVYRALELNAIEFINSNRGTNKHNKKYKVHKVSSLYARNRTYFPDFNADLSAHLVDYIEGDGRKQSLAKAKVTLKPEINDWTVTDLWGTFPEVRSGIANSNPAALMDAIVGGGVPSSAYLSMVGNRYSPMLRTEVFKYLLTLNMKRVRTNEKNSTVTMEELGEFPDTPDSDQENQDN